MSKSVVFHNMDNGSKFFKYKVLNWTTIYLQGIGEELPQNLKPSYTSLGHKRQCDNFTVTQVK